MSNLVRGRLLRLLRLQLVNCRSPWRAEEVEAQCQVSRSSRGMAVDPNLEAAAAGTKEVVLLVARSLRPDGLVEVQEAPCMMKKLCCDLVGVQ